jgi:hypothetical protein
MLFSRRSGAGDHCILRQSFVHGSRAREWLFCLAPKNSLKVYGDLRRYDLGMSHVSDIHIESAWNEVSEASSSPELISDLMDRFGESEPVVADFIAEAAAQWGGDATDLAYHAALVIWRAVQTSGQFPNAVKPETLIGCFEKNSAWLEQQQGEAILVQKKLSDFSKFPEPELMRYAVELVLEAHEDGLEIEPEEQEELLLVLKTLIDSFTSAITP